MKKVWGQPDQPAFLRGQISIHCFCIKMGRLIRALVVSIEHKGHCRIVKTARDENIILNAPQTDRRENVA